MNSHVSAATATSNAQRAQEMQLRVLAMQKQAIHEAGEQALKLIQAAALPPDQGRLLDVHV